MRLLSLCDRSQMLSQLTLLSDKGLHVNVVDVGS